MTLGYELKGGRILYSGYGVIVCYDAPTLEVVEGHGKIPRHHLNVIRKLESAGKVSRLQQSVLLVKDPTALHFIIDALERVNARYLVVEGRIEGTWGEPE